MKKELRETYDTLRREGRETLSKGGISSNPYFMDMDIIDGIRRMKGLEPTQDWKESSYKPEDSLWRYKFELIRAIQESGVTIEEPINETTHIVTALCQLLVKPDRS